MLNNGIINISGANILHLLMGTFDVYDMDDSRSVVEAIAPSIDAAGRRNQGVVVGNNSIVNATGLDNPTEPVGYSAPARAGSQSFDTFEWVTHRYAFASVIIPDSDAAEAASWQINLESVWMETYVPQAWDITLAKIADALANTGNYAASMQTTSLVLTPTVDLVGFLEGVKIAFRELGNRPNGLKVIYNQNVNTALLNVLQVTPTYNLAGVPSGGSLARSGSTTSLDVEEFFRRHGFEPVLADAVIERSSGVEQILADDLYFIFADQGRSRAFINRGVPPASFGNPAAPASYPVYNPFGVGMFMDGQWGLALRSNKLGFIAQGVLS